MHFMDQVLNSVQEMILLEDLSTGFKVTGTLFRPNDNEKQIYFDKIKITLFNNGSLVFDKVGWRLENIPNSVSWSNWDHQHVSIGNVKIGSIRRSNQSYQMVVSIVGGVTFRYVSVPISPLNP